MEAKKARKLLKLTNVVMVGRGHKVTAGLDTGREAIVVGVVKKIPSNQLRIVDIVPKTFEGVETDVIEVGEIKALDDRTSRYRPASPGLSIGHFMVTAGTFGALVRKSDARMILSNAHVLANVNDGAVGDPVLQPGVYDGGNMVSDQLGYLFETVPIKFDGESTCPIGGLITKLFNWLAGLFHRKTRLYALAENDNLVDCAIARPESESMVLDNILEIGVPTGYADAQMGEIIRKSGRTTGVTQGSVVIVDATVQVNYGNDGVAVFSEQIVSDMHCEGGDSGSAVVNEDAQIVGLLFAGSENFTIINNIGNVIDALGLDR